jgi:hypothetical protein
MSIAKTLSSLNKTGGGRPISDMDMVKWANGAAAKGKIGTGTIRSFKDPSLTTGLFFLNVLDGIRPGIVDPALVLNVSESGDYEERRQNGESVARPSRAGCSPCLARSQARDLHCTEGRRAHLPRAGGHRRRAPASGETFPSKA